MAKLSLPTKREVASPLLIDVTQLEALDNIIDRHTEPLRTHREQRLNEAVSNEIRRRVDRGLLKEEEVETRRANIEETVRARSGLDKDYRSVALYLPRFSEVISQPVGEGELPLGFVLYFGIGNVQARVTLANSSWRKEMSIEVEPNELELAQELFGALSNWVSDIEAPRWQQKWVEYRFIFGICLMLWLVFGLFGLPLANWSDAGQNANKAEARKLLGQGINPNNQQRALELILAIESEYNAGVQTPSLGVRYWTYFAFGALFFIVAVISPGVAIGIWRGRYRLRRWKAWVRLVTVTIPILLVSSLVLPWLLHWLHLSPPGQ